MIHSSTILAKIWRVPLEEACTQGARHFVRNIDLTIKPKSKRGPIKSPKVMVRECPICRGLVNAGLCTFPPKEEVTETEDGPLLNGSLGSQRMSTLETRCFAS